MSQKAKVKSKIQSEMKTSEGEMKEREREREREREKSREKADAQRMRRKENAINLKWSVREVKTYSLFKGSMISSTELPEASIILMTCS